MPNIGAFSTKSPAAVVIVWVPWPSASRAEHNHGPGPVVLKQNSPGSAPKTVV